MAEKDESSDRLLRIQAAFKKYRVEIDAKHDLYEKLVKKGRDITIESKRIIFLLHRQTTVEDQKKILDEAKKRLREVYNSVIFGIGSLLISEDVYQYLPAFTGGMQEFVEALAFYYYLKCGEVVSLEQINNGEFLFDENVNVDESKDVKKLPMSTLLTPMDYILGIADLTGELMRKCIASGNLEEPFKLRTVLKDIYSAFLCIGNCGGREITRKMHTLKASLNKVENACYTIKVRGSEMEQLLAGNQELAGKQILTLDDVFSSAQEMPRSAEDSLFCD